MSYKNNKSANAYDMTDFKTRLQLRNEDMFDLIVEDESELNEGPYIGSIIAYSATDNHKIVATIRIPKLHDYQIPINRCADENSNIRKYNSGQDKMLAFNHITAVSTFYTNNPAEKESSPNSYTNLEVLVYFRGASPKQGGKTRNAEFDLLPDTKANTIDRKGRGCYETGGGVELKDGQVAGLFADGAGQLLHAQSEVIISKSTKIQISEFIELLKNSGYFKDWTPESICGMIANAQHESKFRTTIGGDPPSYWGVGTDKYKRIVKYAVVGHGYAKEPQFYCSWGYWQLQICTRDGAGREAATRAGINTTTEKGKAAWAAWVADPNMQFEYINYKLKKLGLHNLKSAEEAGTKICTDFERPSGSQASFDAVHKSGKKVGKKVNKCPARGKTSLAIWKEYKTQIREITVVGEYDMTKDEKEQGYF